ncbi:MAG: BMP family ABC transporter substrate-binding protein, partial [Actinobacteria bacterium]|nr:BMP family ABC transporter substrate-binding protein [Actinomycetota bacterium]
MKKSLRYVALLTAATFAVGITVAPIATASASVKLCIALDTGGVDDHSFNASAWAGAQASDKFTKTKATYLPAASTADFVPNLKKLVDNKCTIIVGVGYQIGSAIMASAAANPTVKFAIVDNDGADHGPNFDQYPGKTFPNLKALQFSTDES